TLLSQNFPTRGALAELLAVPPELETAVSAALGTYLEALIVADYDAVDSGAVLLGSGSGRAAMLPLQGLQPREPLNLPDDPDVDGIAASVVGAEDWARPAAERLLGRVLIVRTAAAARRLLPGLPADGLAVTLDGTVFAAAGPVIAGRHPTPPMLEQARERRDLSRELEDQ